MEVDLCCLLCHSCLVYISWCCLFWLVFSGDTHSQRAFRLWICDASLALCFLCSLPTVPFGKMSIHMIEKGCRKDMVTEWLQKYCMKHMKVQYSKSSAGKYEFFISFTNYSCWGVSRIIYIIYMLSKGHGGNRSSCIVLIALLMYTAFYDRVK